MAQEPPAADAKLDESLRETVARGCIGPQSVIIRTQAGYRAGLRDALTEHGDTVKGEFPGLDAVAADIHCDDLAALASFSSIKSISVNAPVGVQQLLSATSDSSLTLAQIEVTTATVNLAAAQSEATTAQRNLRAAESAARVA